MDKDLQRELARLQNEFGIVPDLDKAGRLHVTPAQFAALREADNRRWSPDAPATKYTVEIVVD